MKLRLPIPKFFALTCVLLVLLASACKRGPKIAHGDLAYVAAPQANLRDRLSAIYNKVAVLKNGEKVEILEKNKRFVRVRSARGEEGWMEARLLVGQDIYDQFAALAKDNAKTPSQGRGVTRAELNMHSTPGRETDHLWRLDEAAKVELLKRATAEKPQTKPVPTSASADPTKAAAPAPVYEDFWLVRDAQGHTGWVLARMIDVDVPMDIAQYAEGQRIMAAYVLNQVADVNPETGQTRQVPQYLTVVNEPKDGTPWDFNQLRVFTWNGKRHRYETAYRERNLVGVFPVEVGHEIFDKEGDLPFFVIRKRDDTGNITATKYKLNGPIVRRVLSPAEQQKVAEEQAAKKAAAQAAAAQRRTARKATAPVVRRHRRR